MNYKETIGKKLNAILDDKETRSAIASWGAGEMVKALEPIAQRKADKRYIPKHERKNAIGGAIEGWNFKTVIRDIEVNLWVYLGKDYNGRPELHFCYETNLKESPREISQPCVKLANDAGLRITWGEATEQIKKWMELSPVKTFSVKQRLDATEAAIAVYEAYKKWEEVERVLGYTLDKQGIRYWGYE